MADFALFQEGAFVRVQAFDNRPDPNPNKGFAWYPVGNPVDGSPAGWAIVGDEAIETRSAATTPPRRQGSFIEFMALFTPAEQAALAGAAMQNVQIKIWYDQAVGADRIDLDSVTVIAGFEAMVAAGLLTHERRTAILGSDFNA